MLSFMPTLAALKVFLHDQFVVCVIILKEFPRYDVVNFTDLLGGLPEKFICLDQCLFHVVPFKVFFLGNM